MRSLEAVKDLVRRARATVRRHPVAADAVVAILFAAAALLGVAALRDDIMANLDQIRASDPSFRLPSTVTSVLSMLGITLPLAWRRRFPFSVLIVAVVGYLVSQSVLKVPEPGVTVLAGSLAIYSAAAYGHRRFRTLVLALCIGGILAEVARQLYFVSSDIRPLLQSFSFAWNVALLALPWVAGAVIRSLRESKRELADRAAELQQEREENARQAVFAERVRIARELHDVVAHHVSVMGVQAGAARRVMERQPEKAAEALSSIEASSRQAVVELHRLLGFLRRAGEADDLAPQPGLAQLGDLVAHAAQGDLAVELSIEGDPRPLSTTLEVSAYRVIQEALTNTRKHSGAAHATVRVTYGTASLEVEVVDDGKAGAARTGGDEGGLGLIGMRERASLHGGHLRAGPRPEGGFVVHATFPLNGSGPTASGPEPGA
jgi:signal transduction histidine kinase